MKRTEDAPATQATQSEHQAAAWLVRLDAKDSAETLRQWDLWMQEDVRRRAAFIRLEQAWRQTDRLRSLKPLDGTVDPDVLDTFPGMSRTAGKPKVSLADLAIQTVAVALAAGMLAGKLVACCWLFINPDSPL